MAYIDEKDIYKLFENGCGIERLHVVQIDELPRVDAVEVRHGEWGDTGEFDLDTIYSGWKCSVCGYVYCGGKTNYCANCGAKMDGERKVSE